MENHVNNVTSGGLTSAGTPEDPYVVLVQDVANTVAKEPTNFTAPKDVYDLLSSIASDLRLQYRTSFVDHAQRIFALR